MANGKEIKSDCLDEEIRVNRKEERPAVTNIRNKDPREKMKFDSLFPIIGDFGRYQVRVYILLCLPAVLCAMHKLAWVFLGAKVDYR